MSKSPLKRSHVINPTEAEASNSKSAKLGSYIRLKSPFFTKSCTEVAKSLLGCLIIRNIQKEDNTEIQTLIGRIVETEAYLGNEDKASHSHKGKKTPRNTAMFMKPGTAYVYKIYGMYSCFNISTLGEGAAVLIRACEPIQGLETMAELRPKPKSKKELTMKQLLNGPSKLCQGLDISKTKFNQFDLLEESQSEFYLAVDCLEIENKNIVEKPRIGIGNYAEEWTNKPLRFYIKDSTFVSVK